MTESLKRSEFVLAKILQHLVDAGLRSNTVNFKTLGLDEDFRPYFATSIKWLKRKGLVHFENVAETIGIEDLHAYGTVLTSRGFEVLGREIEVSSKKTTIAAEVERRASDGVSYSGIGDFLGSMLGGFTKSMGSS